LFFIRWNKVKKGASNVCQRCCIGKVAVLSARNFRRKFRSW